MNKLLTFLQDLFKRVWNKIMPIFRLSKNIPTVHLRAEITLKDRPPFVYSCHIESLSEGIDRLLKGQVYPYLGMGVFEKIQARVFIKDILVATSDDKDLITWNVLITKEEFTDILRDHNKRTKQNQ